MQQLCIENRGISGIKWTPLLLIIPALHSRCKAGRRARRACSAAPNSGAENAFARCRAFRSRRAAAHHILEACRAVSLSLSRQIAAQQLQPRARQNAALPGVFARKLRTLLRLAAVWLQPCAGWSRAAHSVFCAHATPFGRMHIPTGRACSDAAPCQRKALKFVQVLPVKR